MRKTFLYNLLMSLLRLEAFLPFCILYVISDTMFLFVYYILRYRRKTVNDNLYNSFPEKNDKERRKIERKFYKHFCDCIVETIKLLHLTNKEIDKRIIVTNGSLIEQIAEDGAPIILYLGHYGNWEWTPAVTRHYTRPAFNGQIYRPLHNRLMEQVMLTIRSRFHTISIPQKSAFRTLLQLKQENKQFLIGFVADQRPNSGNLHHWTTFLHQDTAYSTGGEEIGKRTGAHFVYLEIEKIKRGHYQMTFRLIPPLQDGKEYPYTRQFMNMMENSIRRAPEYWLWSHKRWRFSRPALTTI